MPFVFCEVCNYMGRGITPKAMLDDVLDHESREHCRCIDADFIFEQEMQRREEDAKLKRCYEAGDVDE